MGSPVDALYHKGAVSLSECQLNHNLKTVSDCFDPGSYSLDNVPPFYIANNFFICG